LPESRCTVEAVPIRQSERFAPVPSRDLRQVLGGRGSLEEGERASAAKLDVRNAVGHSTGIFAFCSSLGNADATRPVAWPRGPARLAQTAWFGVRSLPCRSCTTWASPNSGDSCRLARFRR